MADLVDKYFKEDLTEAEQSALGELLSSSDEASLKFEATAKEAYFRYGFPDPQPRWGDSAGPSSPHKPGLGPLILPSLFVLAGAALLGWWGSHPGSLLNRFFATGAKSLTAQIQSTLGGMFQPSKYDEKSSSASTQSEKSIVLTKAGQGKPVPAANAPKKEIVSASTVVRTPESVKLPSIPPQSVGDSKPLPVIAVRQAYTPVNLDQNPSKSYSGLSVQVGQSQLGFLTVRVLDNRGKEIVTLYRGNLGLGNWVFEWDGKSPDGRPAAPGYYQIKVHSGSFIQHKTVQIQ